MIDIYSLVITNDRMERGDLPLNEDCYIASLLAITVSAY